MAKHIRVMLDELLRDRGMSRYKLEQLTGIPLQTLSKYYKNKQVESISFTNLAKMCSALDCEVGELLVLTEDRG